VARTKSQKAMPRLSRRMLLWVIPLVLLCGFIVLTRSPLTRRLIEPRIERLIGAELDSSSVVIGLDGSLIINNAVLTVPGVAGEAGELLRVDRLRAKVDWWGVLGGTPRLFWVRFDHPVARISVDRDSAELNFASCRLPGSEGGAIDELPRIEVHDGIIQLGEHDASGWYESLKSVRVDGTLAPSGEVGTVGGYVIRLDSTEDSTLSEPIDVTGAITQNGLSLVLQPISLKDWPASSTPSVYRELLEQLDMDGRVRQTRFSYSYDGAVSAAIVFDGVALTLPFDVSGEIGGDRLARMREVNGVITFERDRVQADLRGSLEDMPYEVSLAWHGTDVNAPFTCELLTTGYELLAHPEILPFAPRDVREKLVLFNNPTAILDARVLVERSAGIGDKPGPINVKGWIDFHDGTAAFEEMPYPFEGLSGLVVFDDELIQIVDVSGVGVGGGTVSASGTLTSTDEDAVIELDIKVRGIPIDEHMKRALGEGNGSVVDALFDAESHQRLLDQGLIATPAQAKRGAARAEQIRLEIESTRGEVDQLLIAEADELERLAARPVFDLGGVVDADVQVRRDPDAETVWSRDVLVRLPSAGIVANMFPVPVYATDVELLIGESNAKLIGGRFEGLTGGAAEVSADIGFGGETLIPNIRIDAEGVPVDDRLLAGLPSGDNSGPFSIRENIAQLHIDGTIDCEAWIGRRDAGTLGYEVAVTLDQLAASPDNGVGLEQITGRLRADENAVDLTLTGTLHDGASGDACGNVLIEAHAPMPGVDSPLSVRVSASNTDIGAPIETLLEAMTPTAAEKLRGLRSRFNPTGSLDVTAAMDRDESGRLRVEVEVDRCKSVEFDAAGGRVAIDSDVGRVDIVGDLSPVVRFDHFGGRIRFDGEPGGRIELDGFVEFDGDNGGVRTSDLGIKLTDAMFESAAVGKAVERFMGSDAATKYTSREPAGRFGIDARYVGDAERGPIALSGRILPKRIGSLQRGRRINIDDIGGEIEFGRRNGAIRALSGRSDGWRFGMDGIWIVDDAAISASLDLSLSSDGLPDDLRAMLPEGLIRSLERASFAINGPLELTETSISINLPRDESTTGGVYATGVMHVRDASAKLGFDLTEANGSVSFEIENNQQGATFGVDLLLDTARCAKLRLESARISIRGKPDGRVVIPLISGDCHGGRVSGSVLIEPTLNPDAGRPFRAVVRLADVRFASVLADMRNDEEPAELSEIPRGSIDDSRGALDADLTLGGIVGRIETFRGRGALRVSGGEVVDLPLLTPLIEVSNLRLPTNERLDFARADLYIDGGLLAFEDLSVFSRSVRILGYGTVGLPGLGLDLRFTTQSASRIPLLSDLVEGVRDEFVTMRVRGTLGDEAIETVQFTGTRRLLDQIFGVEPSPEEQRLRQIERRVRRERARLGRTTRSEQASVPKSSG